MIIRTHSRTLFAIAYGILQSREEAEDVVQDSLVKAWKTRWRVRDPEKFPAWLATVARHKAHEFSQTPHGSFVGTTDRTDRTRAGKHECFGSKIALRACSIAGPSSGRAHVTLFRRDGLPHHRKHAWVFQWRAARNSGPRSRPCANNFARFSLQWTKPMATIHDEIDNWLAADLHNELSNSERSALHAHLLDCGACRKTHQEIKVMNKILEETLAHEKPDPAFEQRMLAGFRNRVPQRSGLVNCSSI